MSASANRAILEVRARHIRTGHGWTMTEFTVDCPFRDQSIDLDVCEQCAAYEAVSQQEESIPRAVVCGRVGFLAREADRDDGSARGLGAAVLRAAASGVLCVRPDVSLREAADILLREHFKCLPVVDDEVRPLGMVTRDDLTRLGLEFTGEAIHDRAFGARGLVADAMTTPVDTIWEHASVLEAARLMAERGFNRLTITARDGRIVGLVTARDILRWLSGPGCPKGMESMEW